MKARAFCLGAVLAVSLHPATGRAQKYRYPSDCGSGCITVSAYFDHGGRTDWACGGRTYGGHPGTDFAPYGGFAAVDEGRSVLAAAPGTVVYAHDGEFDRCTSGNCAGGAGFGNYVQLQHADGRYTFYGHMRRGSVTVGAGQTVECGQQLGLIASSGYSTGPHVHFEPRAGRSFDPYAGGCGGDDLWVDQGAYLDLPSTSCEGPSQPPDQPPGGYLDAVDADGIRGWAWDPDEPDRALDVHVYIGGPAGSPDAVGFSVTSGGARQDLCEVLQSCNHAFNFRVPRRFLDGVPRPVFAYAIGADNPLLINAPMTLVAPPPALPLDANQGVLRWVQNPDSMAAWHFDWNDVVTVPDAQLAAYAQGPAWPLAPSLVQADADPAVYVHEYAVRRHVLSPTSMDDWHFDWAAIQPASPSDVEALSDGAPMPDRPFFVVGSTGAIMVVDHPPPLWAGWTAPAAPVEMMVDTTAEVTVMLRNRGSATWQPSHTFLVATGSTPGLCDGSWTDCLRAARVDQDTATGADGTFRVKLHAPPQAGDVTQCFTLDHGSHRVSEPGQGGPADGIICLTAHVTAAAVTVSSSSASRSVSASMAFSSMSSSSGASATTSTGASSSTPQPSQGSAVSASPAPDAGVTTRGCSHSNASGLPPWGLVLLLSMFAGARRRHTHP